MVGEKPTSEAVTSWRMQAVY